VCYVCPWLQVLSRLLRVGYGCGEFFQNLHCREGCIRAKDACHSCFGKSVSDRDKPWAPHVICEYCCRTQGLFRGEKRATRFLITPYLAWAHKQFHRLLFPYGRSKQMTERKECTFHQVPWHSDIPSSIASVTHNTIDMLVPQPTLRDESFKLHKIWNGAIFCCLCLTPLAGARCPY